MEKGGTADAEKEKVVEGLKKGAWTREEDEKLLDYILHFGHGSWRSLPAKAGLRRCGKSCRLRWTNYLRPDIKRGKFSFQEQQTIIQLHALLGNRWSTIATHLPRRTDNEIKNYWNTHLKKRLTKMGIDPMTHKPKSNGPHIANLSHMAQWESARLQAEARLGRDSSSKRTTPTNPRFQPHKPSLTPICLDVFKACQGGANWLKPPIDPSPTSTLSFSENLLPLPSSLFGFGDVAAIHYNKNLGAFEGETTRVKQVEWTCLKENGVEDGGKSMTEGNMTTSSSVVVDNNIESNNYRGTLDNVVGTGSLEAENKDYWNNILLYGLNTWASDSPVLF